MTVNNLRRVRRVRGCQGFDNRRRGRVVRQVLLTTWLTDGPDHSHFRRGQLLSYDRSANQKTDVDDRTTRFAAVAAYTARVTAVGRVLPLVAHTGRSHDDGQGTAHLQPFA